MIRLTNDRVLRALSRFDVATVNDVAGGLGRNTPGMRRSVWQHLQQLVDAGLAAREGKRGHIARYVITDAGRAAIAREAA